MITVGEIQAALDEEDIESLLMAGAPSDEYEEEARMIFDALATKETVTGQSDIVSVLTDVWTQMFGVMSATELADRMPAFSRIADRLLKSAT